MLPTGLNACCDLQLRVTVEDKCENTDSDTSGCVTVDNTPPVINSVTIDPADLETSTLCPNESPCLVGGETGHILVDYTEVCGPTTGTFRWKCVSDNGWHVIATDVLLDASPHSQPWSVPATLDCCDIVVEVTITDCPGQTDTDTVDTCSEAPLDLVDCITGWAWSWGPRTPVNANATNTIMVVFNKPLELDGEGDCGTVTPSDFQVVGKTITGIDIHKDGISSRDGGAWQGYTYVFLTVTPIMATDAKPTVKLVGCISSDPEEASPEELDGREVPIECIAQDGIAPILTVTPSTEKPEYNELVTVTVTASECLNEAYLFVGKGSPNYYDWNWCKPIGWPTDWWTQGDDNRVPDMCPLPEPCPQPEDYSASYPEWGEITFDDPLRQCVWENWECCRGPAGPPERGRGCWGYWLAMDPVDDNCDPGSKTWTVTFRNTDFNPSQEWFIEAAGHDFSHWLPTFPWKHEKWTQESFLFWGLEVFRLELCEGWNLVSVPWHLDDPTPAGAFGPAWAYGTVGYGGITKAYYYTGGTYGTWKYTALSPVTWTWTGTLTSIVPGEAYWVWVSPPWMDWILRTVEPDNDGLNPMVPPAYSLKKGWNMVGYTILTEQNWTSTYYFQHYVRTLWDNALMCYVYDPCDQEYGRGWVRFNSGFEGGAHSWQWMEPVAGFGYWLYLMEDGILVP